MAQAESLTVDTSQVSGAFYLDHQAVSTPGVNFSWNIDPELVQLLDQASCAPTSDQVQAGIGEIRDYHQFQNHHFFTSRGQMKINYATLAPGAALSVEANLCSSSGLSAEQICADFLYRTPANNPQTATYVSADPMGEPAVVVFHAESVRKSTLDRRDTVCFRNRGPGHYKLSLKNASSRALELVKSSASVGSGFLFNY